MIAATTVARDVDHDADMLVALVLARVIAEAGSPAPNLDDGDILLIKRGCGECNAQRPVRGDWLTVMGVVLLTLRRKRRRR